MTFFQVNNVKKEFDDFTLGPIQLTVEPGTISAIIGSNGSGKSTLLKIIMDLIHQDQGNILFFGEPTSPTYQAWKKYIAYLPQKQIGMDSYNAVTLASLYDITYPKFNFKTFNHLVTKFKINKRKKFQKLSPGEQQKLRLALTFSTEAKLLILDEPTSFIDIQAKNDLFDFLIQWMDDQERSIILSTHQEDEIRKLADYIIPIERGKILGNYEKEVLIEQYREYLFYEAMPPINIPGELLRKGMCIISNAPAETEKFLSEQQITPLTQTRLELDEVIPLILEQQQKEN